MERVRLIRETIVKRGNVCVSRIYKLTVTNNPNALMKLMKIAQTTESSFRMYVIPKQPSTHLEIDCMQI